jgi:hypothetical protein
MEALANWIEANISDEKLAEFRSADRRARQTAASNWTADDWNLHRLVQLYDHIPRRE